GVNFQGVSEVQQLVEASLGMTGGYLDAFGRPSPALLAELTFVDTALGQMVQALQDQHLYDSTLIIVTAKHGQTPIDPSKLRTKKTGILDPGDVVTALPGHPLAQATEDDI